MLEPLTHHGKDSSGVTVVGEDIEGDVGTPAAPAVIDQLGRNLGPYELGVSSSGYRALDMWV